MYEPEVMCILRSYVGERRVKPDHFPDNDNDQCTLVVLNRKKRKYYERTDI